MKDLRVIEIKAFIPAKDFSISRQFYLDLGFTLASDSDGIAYFHHGDASFLLQDSYDEGQAKGMRMHLLVENVDAWWTHVQDCGIARNYGVEVTNIEERPWRMRDFTLIDPSGVLWRIAQNI